MKRMVTRTIESTNVKAVCYCETDSTLVEQETVISGAHTVESATKKVKEINGYKVVAVKSVEVKTALYGMTEEKFIEQSEILPERNAKKNEVAENV